MIMPATSGFQIQAQAAEGLPVWFAQGWGLRARCPNAVCGASTSIDPRVWIDQGLAGTPLGRLETRLRCLCGERRADLAIEPVVADDEARPAIYVFR